MDPEIAVAVAALFTAIVAMTVALAQLVQQYLITGRLIRMCDSVVYGPMPGQGHRVWQMSQFRFRVVYQIPQIRLAPGLWESETFDDFEDSKSQILLPDLRHDVTSSPKRWFFKSYNGTQKTSAYSAVPGEACWVSFSRMAQHSTGKSLSYEMFGGDADRCPSDLSVVPMQVSMRDIVTISFMTGMRCTDISFDRKCLSMEGGPGTITSSVHPTLGALLRFTPRNLKKPQGLQIDGGTVNSKWVARIWDVITIAGRQYTNQERRYYNTYEYSSWTKLSRDLMVARIPRSRRSSRSSSFVVNSRTRRGSTNSTGLQVPALGIFGLSTPLEAKEKPTVQPSSSDHMSISKSPQDGDWSFEPDEAESEMGLTSQSTSNTTPILGSDLLHSQYSSTLVSEQSQSPNPAAGKKQSTTSPNVSSPQSDSVLPRAETLEFKSSKKATALRFRQRQHLDGLALQRYIESKRNKIPEQQSNGRLLLPWHSGADSDKDQAGSDTLLEQIDDWMSYCKDLKQERSFGYADQWREILELRRQRRENNNDQDEWEFISIHSSRPSSRRRSSMRREGSRDSRSLSKDSRKSRRSSRSAIEDTDIRRGRRMERKQHLQQISFGSVNEIRAESLDEVSQYDEDLDIDDSPSTEGDDFENESEMRPEVSLEENAELKQLRPLEVSTSDQNQVMFSTPELEHSQERKRVEDRSSPVRDTPSREQQTIGPRFEMENLIEELDDAIQSVEDQEQTDLERKKIVFAEHGTSHTPNKERRQLSSRKPTSNRSKKSILKAPTTQFPEDLVTSKGTVVISRESERTEPPSKARYTKIARRLVNPEALEEGEEDFTEEQDHVIVLRVLTREEIQDYANVTLKIRERRAEQEWLRHFDGTESNPTERDENWVNGYPPSPVRGRPRSSVRDQDLAATVGDEDKDAKQDAANRVVDTQTNKSSTGHRDTVALSPVPEEEQSNKPTPGIDTDLRRSESPTSPPGTEENSEGTTISEDSSILGVLPEQDFPTIEKRPRFISSTRSRSRPGSSTSAISLPLTETSSRYQSALSDDGGSVVTEADTEERRTTGSGYDNFPPGAVNWFWICQADVLPGYFASPWQSSFSELVSSGTIAVMREALEDFIDSSTLIHVDTLSECDTWVKQGKSTHPSYAINAMGGIIVEAKYKRVRFSHLTTPIPPIQLLRYPDGVPRNSSTFQGSTPKTSDRTILNRLSELMALDSWLSFCGRLPEIYDGPNQLVQKMPALVQRIMTDFSYEFGNVDRTASEGGSLLIKELADLVVEELEDKLQLEEAEQLFAIVAILRTAKLALCISQGPDTAMLAGLLARDAQVYLV